MIHGSFSLCFSWHESSAVPFSHVNQACSRLLQNFRLCLQSRRWTERHVVACSGSLAVLSSTLWVQVGVHLGHHFLNLAPLKYT